MSDVLDLTQISGVVLGLDREMRLLRLQVDSLASTVPPRLSVIEQSYHDLIGEMSRGLGQMQQQLTRQEKRIDGVDAALAALRTELADSTAQIVEAVKAGPGR
jgi:hypothetical protein